MAEKYRQVPENARDYAAQKARRYRNAKDNFIETFAGKSEENLPVPQELKPEITQIVLAKKVEQEERSLLDKGAFLAGFFEARGNMGIYPKRTVGVTKSGDKYKNVHVNPSLAYNDTDQEKLIRLQRRFGGNIYQNDDERSFRWSLNGYRAVELSREMEPFVQRRREVTYAFSNWINETKEERLQSVSDLKQASTSDLSPELYIDTLDNLAFSAGVYEAGGVIEKRIRGGKSYRTVSINAQNPALLEAMKNKWGGYVQELKPNSRYLKMGQTASREFIQAISPFLVSSPPEGFF